MTPLIGLAVDLLPDLARRLTRDTDPVTQDLVASVVREVLGTDDPAEARRRAEDATLSGELRVRLAEIANAAAARERDAETAARQTQLDTLRAELQADRDHREAALGSLERRLADRADARETFGGLVAAQSPLAWGPVVVSTIVTAGFFVTLAFLIRGGFDVAATDPVVFQVVNIAVGALTAGFATVVSFWLGSSDGSRRKDLTARQVQSETARAQSDTARATRDMVSEQTRRTAALIARVVTPRETSDSTRAPRGAEMPAPAKDARQFARCLDMIFAHEGGFVDHPDDPGGATNMGITHKTLAAWRDVPVTVADVRALTRAEAGEIYRANYWNALHCDGLPAGVDLVVFDFGVNAGVGRAAKLLQRLVHVEQDGQVGPITLAATRAMDAAHIVEAFSAGRMDHYRALRHWDTFGRGWTRRTHEIRDAALAMLGD